MPAASPPRRIAGPWEPWITEFIARAAPWLAFSGLAPTSWWRSAQHNADEQGHPESQHLFALALDAFHEDKRRVEWGIKLARHFGLIGTASPRGNAHVQLYPAGALKRAGVKFPRV